MSKLRCAILITLLLVMVLTTSSCQDNFNPQTENLDWFPVNTPPGYSGSCYGYFITKGPLDQMHSFSSVWCTPQSQTENPVVTLDWQEIPTPPNELGKCYGYFITDGILDQQHSFSGAWCIQ